MIAERLVTLPSSITRLSGVNDRLGELQQATRGFGLLLGDRQAHPEPRSEHEAVPDPQRLEAAPVVTPMLQPERQPPVLDAVFERAEWSRRHALRLA